MSVLEPKRAMRVAIRKTAKLMGKRVSNMVGPLWSGIDRWRILMRRRDGIG